MPFDPWRASAISFDIIAASHDALGAVQRRQSQRLAELLKLTAKASPMYRRLVGSRTATPPLREWPLMSKGALMSQFDAWVTDPRLELGALRKFVADPSLIGRPYLGRYAVWESSGSSGEPAVFVQDPQALAVNHALEAVRPAPLQPLRRYWDPYYLSERLAFVGATTGHFASTVSVERMRHLNPSVAATVRSFSFLQSTAELVAQLNDHAPTIIATYPTAALMLAEEAMAGRLHVPLREMWTGGEALTPSVRGLIKEVFKCPVSNSYGASEFLALACECRCSRLHLNSDWVILESVDAKGREVPAGQAGHTTLLTNLANHVQPLIRYDLGDRVTMASDRCSCGSALPVLEVEGRVDDSLLFEDKQHHPVRLLPLALTTVIEDDAQVFDFQIEQQSADSLMLRLATHGAAGRGELQRARTALKTYLRMQGLANVHIHAQCGEPGVRGRSGKIPRVIGAAS